MKNSYHDIEKLNAQSKGVRTFLLFIVLALIVAAAAYSAVKYWKVSVEVAPEPPGNTRLQR